MRILMYHGRLPEPARKPGGTDIYVHRLAEALTARGHNVELLSHSPAPPGASYEARHPPLRAAADSRVLRQYVAPWLLNFMEFTDFDVVHFHGDDWFCLRRPFPSVRTFHGSALLEARSASSWRRRLDKTLIFGLELLSSHLATSAYGVGVDSQIIYRTDGLLQIGIDVLPQLREPASVPTIVFIGTWGGRKRGALLHRLFTTEIRPAFPTAELWMVSDACEPADGVHWLSLPTDREIQELLSRAWLFCLPSSYEGFGIPYLEAMAQAVPVLASPNPGAEMVLGEGRYGAIAEDHELGSRLVELIQDDRLRHALGEQGLRRAEEYSWEQSMECHENAYRLAMERWRARRSNSAPRLPVQ
jgi:glycosyltransferase involved in cell wall biosynthesis